MAFCMNFKQLARCNAKARSNFNQPCRQAAMRNGKCYWHGGASPIKTGRYTTYAQTAKKQHRNFINAIKMINKSLKNMV